MQIVFEKNTIFGASIFSYEFDGEEEFEVEFWKTSSYSGDPIFRDSFATLTEALEKYNSIYQSLI